MNLWNSVKRMSSQRANIAKQKAIAGVELVGAGAALTGGSMLLEEIVSSKNLQIEGHDNISATDNAATLFKMESLASQEDNVTTMEIIGYITFVLIIPLLFIPCIHVILKIK